MKRSEAIDKMKDIISRYIHDMEFININEEAMYILNFIEHNLGMLPPPLYVDDQPNSWPSTKVCVWESEEDSITEIVAQDAVWVPYET